VVTHDRTAIVAARRGGQDRADATTLQERFATEIYTDIARDGLSVNSLAKAVDIKAGTLKGYLDGTSAWPVGVLRDVARVLGRNNDADLVALGYVSSPLAQRYLLQQQQLRLAEMVQARTALHVAREPLVESAGAQVVAAIITAPDDLAGRLDVRIRRLTRGRRHERTFCDLVIVEVGAAADDYQAAKRTLLSLPIRPIPGKASARLSDALDYYGAHVEESVDYLDRLRRLYAAGPTSVMIIVPGLLATRPAVPGAPSPELDHLDGVAVTSLWWGGAADIASLVAEGADWGYASAEMLARQTFGGGPTLRDAGGDTTAARRSFQLNCRETSELLLNPRVSGRRRVAALDAPAAALDAVRQLAVTGDRQVAPVALVRISAQRVHWTRRLRARDPERPRDAEWTALAATRLLTLQDELSAAVESLRGRPARVFELPEPDADYSREDRDFVDEDFDSYAEAAEDVRRWLVDLPVEVDRAR
jgi:hypothetical protein